MTINSIYTASKASHRPTWRAFRDRGLSITSRWIDVDDKFIGRDLPDDYDFARLWSECLEDVTSADVLVIYVEEGESLKGALVELGCALSLGKHCFLCGDAEAARQSGSWMGHPLVHDMTSYPLDFVMGFATGYDPDRHED